MTNSKQERKVYFNGDFVKESEAKISIYDSALMFGDMVFEMTRSFNGKQWLLRRHLERLYSGIKILRIPMPITIDEMEKAVLQTIEINKPLFEKDDEHRVMIDVSRGLLSLYHGIPNLHKGTNVIIADFPLKWTVQNCSHLYDSGINLHVTSQRAIPSQLMEPKIKNRSRLFYLMANVEASMVKGEDVWALLLDVNGYIAEGTGSNFFMVKNNKIYTPRGKDILRGITMETIVTQIAPSLGIEVIEKDIEPLTSLDDILKVVYDDMVEENRIKYTSSVAITKTVDYVDDMKNKLSDILINLKKESETIPESKYKIGVPQLLASMRTFG